MYESLIRLSIIYIFTLGLYSRKSIRINTRLNLRFFFSISSCRNISLGYIIIHIISYNFWNSLRSCLSSCSNISNSFNLSLRVNQNLFICLFLFFALTVYNFWVILGILKTFWSHFLRENLFILTLNTDVYFWNLYRKFYHLIDQSLITIA